VFYITTIIRVSKTKFETLSLFKNKIYILVITIDHCYYEHNYILIAEKETLKSHLKKQGKAFFTVNS